MMLRRPTKLLFMAAVALCLAPAARAASLATLFNFVGNADGQYPDGKLTSAGKFLYGTTPSGGKYFLGTVFRLDPLTGRTVIVHSFAGGTDGAGPVGPVLPIGGKLYGTTQSGGAANAGTVFAIDGETGAETTVHAFSGGADGGAPAGGLCAWGGALYGTTFYGGAGGFGTAFKIVAATGVFTTLHQFAAQPDGNYPFGTIVELSGRLYGATGSGGTKNAGTVFVIDPQTEAVSKLYDFTASADGDQPLSSLIAAGGQLYGTAAGGTTGWGTVYKIDPVSKSEKTLYNFSGNADGAFPVGLVALGNTLYGTADSSNEQAGAGVGGGTVFTLDLTTGAEQTLHGFNGPASGGTDGFSPLAALTAVDGMLYGSAGYGGQAKGGTLFRLDPSSGTLTTLHDFLGASPHSSVNAGLVPVLGQLYGTSALAGKDGLGSIFRIRPGTGATGLLHAFGGGTDGAAPHGALVNVGGTLYGTTTGPGGGTIYSVDPRSGAESVIDVFPPTGNGPMDPQAELTDVGGVLYGTSYGGGAGAGTIFRITPANGQLITLYTFATTSPAGFPKGGLLNIGNALYGTTSGLVPGSATSTVFKYDMSTGTLTTLHTFTAAEGLHPVGTLIESGGLLYGITSTDGKAFNGTVFSLDPASLALTTLHAFSGGADGGAPMAGLIAVNGQLYGTNSAGGAGHAGTVFNVDPASGALTTLHAFTGAADGGAPAARLVARAGVLYGTTSTGGANNRGTVFALTP